MKNSEVQVLGTLATESIDPRYDTIDSKSVEELAHLMNEADAQVPTAVRNSIDQIVPAITTVVEHLRGGGRLFYVGAGTSGRIGILDASECPPTFSTPPELVQGIIAGGDAAITTAIEGAEDDPDAGAREMQERGVTPKDVVVGIASSGRTPYVLGAISYARKVGAGTIGLSCNSDSALSRAAEHAIEVEVGPEFISGSTRLKAGTAQKLVLNMISTISMIRLGKTYGNLMIDVKATNDKLYERAIRIVSSVAGASREDALLALDSVDFNVKLAIIRIRRGVDVNEATALLEAADGNLRRVIGELT